ncbi:hypothetical protein [Aureimonas glaciei]|uniref:Uncharacterized protein n=1 Tax=Aureimonas glaciei TaxID=1776957 RepID=A0A916YGN9_9HYPH|nr:hypothetical protein [Aureimonas glaciei]GGD42537.1 hypothetical protein GCM10011335_51540 [Aureimonas glaciei]
MSSLRTIPLEGEVLPPQAMLSVVAAMHPLKPDHDVVFVLAGSSVEEIVARCAEQCGVSRLADGAYVAINGHPIPHEIWHRVRVKDGAHVVVRATAGKGMGGILKSILQIALVIIGTAVGGPVGGALGAALTAGIAFGGSLVRDVFPAKPRPQIGAGQ